MKLGRIPDGLSLHLAILRCAGWLVPREQRAEWLAEWRSELWYVERAAGPRDWSASWKVAAFCLGAFQDALWLRRNRHLTLARGVFRLESALQCVLFLAALAGASVFFALSMPVARGLGLTSPYGDAKDLAMISGHGHFGGPAPTIPLELYQAWAAGTRSRFTDLAFYRPVLERVPIDGRSTAQLSIAVASDNLFELLSVPVPRVSGEHPANRAGLMLSRAAWRKYFAGDPHIVGRAVEVGGQATVVAGVLEEGAWRLPGRVDAWLLEDAQQLARLPARSTGFVLAHLRGSRILPRGGGLWHISLPNEREGSSEYDCLPLDDHVPRPWGVVLLVVVFTWAALRGVPLSQGQYSANRESPGWPGRLRQWSFLSIKIALLLPIVIFGALDLAFVIASIAGVHLEGPALLAAWIVAARWVVRDQRQRCPVCLRLLINPVGIGQASQTFLGWYGTELMCAKGHGLLHVPEIPTSSSSMPRWIRLDPSWSGLF